MTDSPSPQIEFARIRIHNMERSHIWRAVARDLPEGSQLVLGLRQPFMNFKDARSVLAELLGEEVPTKLRFMSFKGRRTFYPTPAQAETLTEQIDSPKESKPLTGYATSFRVENPASLKT